MTMTYPFDFAAFIDETITEPLTRTALLRLYRRHAAAFPTAIRVELHRLLDANRCIAAVWSIADVQQVRPDLSDDQAWQTLQRADADRDDRYGITWDSLEYTALELFGTPPDGADATNTCRTEAI